MSLLHALARIVIIALIALTPLSTAMAQGDAASKKEAIGLYKKGRLLLSRGKYQDALETLDKSLELLPSPNTGLLRAHALRELDRLAAAMTAYEQVQAQATERVNKGERRFKKTLLEAGRWSTKLRGKLGELSITVRDAPGGATLNVDEEIVGTAEEGESSDITAKVWHLPGTAEVVARGADGREVSESAEVTVGEVATLTLDFPEPEPTDPDPGDVGPVEPDPVDPQPDGDAFPMPPLPAIIAGAVGVVGFGLFAGFGLASSSTASDLDECTPSCATELREDADAGKRNQLIANIGLIVGATGVTAFGAIWLITALTGEPASDEADDVALTIGPGSLGVIGRF